MIRIVRSALALVAGLGIAAAAPALLHAQDGAPPLAQRDKVWAQSYAKIAPDPAVRFGTLPNGMRYAVMRNATPLKQASLRLRVGSGSLEETDAQQGLAHFLEHMAFNGSAHVPQGEMIRILERHGLAFGADTNASTDWTQTVYKLDLPQADDDTLDTGLMLMREAAGELTLAQGAMDTERGVVLSEERARDTPNYRTFKAQLGFLLKGQLAANRLPIGTTRVLQTADAALIRSYYDAWYRPDRTTLIAVGDFDPAAMEAKIKARFSDWRPRSATPPPEPDLGAVAKRGTEAKVMVEPGGSASISIGWLQPFDAAPDSEAKRRRDLVEMVAFQVMGRRLERIARSDKPPFISAAAGADDYFRSAKVVSLSVSTDPDHWREGLLAAEEARRRAVQFGVRQDEVDRELTELRAQLQAAADGAATRRTPRLAEELAQSVDEDQVFTSPAQDLELFKSAVQGLGAAEVSAALKRAFAGEGPLVFMSTPKAVEGGEATLLAAFTAAEASAVAPSAAQEVRTWPYTSFGAPGTVADSRDVVDLDTTFVRYVNGVKLTVKQTKFRDQQILVSVRVGHGRIDLPKDRQTASWAAGFAFTEGGLKAIDKEDMEQVLASRIYGVNFGIGDDAFTLSGATRPQDFETQLQVLTAYLTAPGFRPEAFQRMKTYGSNLLRQMEATPQGVLRRDLASLLHAGDPRWSFPDAAQIEAGKPDDVKALLQKPLAEGPIEVVIVGDVSLERAVKAVGDTLGALPPRAPAPVDPAGLQVRFPAPTREPVVRTHKGRADQAVAYLAWPTGDFFADPQQQRALRLLQLVLERRLVDTVRIAQGSTYSPSADWESSLVYPGFGYISADVEIPPAKIAGFYADVAKIAADLRDKEVGADELERARKPRLEAIQKAQQTNEYWLGQLSGAEADPRRIEAIRASLAGLERVRAADIRRVAQQYLTDERAWKLIVGPGADAAAAPPVSAAPPVPAAAPPPPAPAPAPAPPPEPPAGRVVGPTVETPAEPPAPPAKPERQRRAPPHRG
ncbi:MAG TPA: insulinase family protein [Caulobacteraceae bacterium]|jgi:zinc protease|nr:insulinase family protein [Caulobacteraceae bacterium]